MVHLRGCDVWRKAFPLGVRISKDLSDGVPGSSTQRCTHLHGRIADAVEDLKYLLIAVNMSFCDLPIVRPRISRFACVADGDAAFECSDINVESLAFDAGRSEFDRCHAAVLGRIVVLKSGRNTDHLTFDICCDRNETIGRVTVADEFVESTYTSDVQSR